MKEHELASTILSRLGALLSQVPSVRSVDSQPEALGGEAGRADGALAVTLVGGAVHTLVVEAKGNAQPRNVRDAARRLTAHINALRSDGVPHPSAILGAPYVSERSAAVLAEHGVGHLDLAGNARLAFGPVYVERSGLANPHAVERPYTSLFAPKTSRVARALLAHPARVWRLQELADELDVSLGLVAKAKASLLDGEYARDSPDGLALADPNGLLNAWLAADRRRPKPRGYYSLDSVSEAERRIADAARASGARAALTSFSGAERVAPHVRYSHASILIEADALKDVAERAGLRPVETGANVRLHEPYDNGAFYGAHDVDGVPVVHPVQLVLDLAREKGRGEEAADFLRRHALAPAWADLRR
ncbi:type IV toxin-antitoxin system AbiEi family antitoxin [Rubricoccus marinus]|uniref:Uncharacterized protein n=1 Tax=Rubricoccus marinus TaxID=716817 RepID=A0A259TUQ3_9BACT|nr:type IV toxin-antitoxin system AbiEi family antitoxin [Rubricoccus marinus]OZC01461.1 hypothetical protein BSZ36_17445 [Rubricoccus marinus]